MLEEKKQQNRNNTEINCIYLWEKQSRRDPELLDEGTQSKPVQMPSVLAVAAPCSPFHGSAHVGGNSHSTNSTCTTSWNCLEQILDRNLNGCILLLFFWYVQCCRRAKWAMEVREQRGIKSKYKSGTGSLPHNPGRAGPCQHHPIREYLGLHPASCIPAFRN